MNKLQEARHRIDAIDAEMARLFKERMAASRMAAEYKMENGLAVFDSTREEEVIWRNAKNFDDDELKPYYISFLKYTMTLSKNYQHRLLEGMKIAYSGVPGAFGYIAARRIYPESVPVSYNSFAEAYKAVEEGECDCAVLPIENSFAGDVAQVLDLMFFGSLFVTGVYDLEVVHNLLGNAGATINTVKEVISHPQALEQCMPYIEKQGFVPTECANTAVAAKQVASSGRTDIAAIASIETAMLYGLNVIDTKINQSSTNTTRFAVFSKAPNRESESHNHFIMFFTVKNEAGSLGKAVSVIGEQGFNMKALKSRPTKELIWDYYFFVESYGNIYGEKGREMLSKLSEVCSNLKVVGSFDREIRLEN